MLNGQLSPVPFLPNPVFVEIYPSSLSFYGEVRKNKWLQIIIFGTLISDFYLLRRGNRLRGEREISFECPRKD